MFVTYLSNKFNIVCNTFLKRALGLMFSAPKCVILKTKRESIAGSSIHMLFVFFRIDAVWLDKNLRIVDFKKNMLPFISSAAPRRKAKYVFEIPSKLRKKIGMEISLGEKASITEI